MGELQNVIAHNTLAKAADFNAVQDGVRTGWTPCDTWVYASASTFTITGVNQTNVYHSGMRLRWKQGGAYLYSTVDSSAYVTNTTVTITGGDALTNAVITDNYRSYVTAPEGYSYTAASVADLQVPQYLTLATSATLTNERVFTPGAGLSSVDGGAGGLYTLNITNLTSWLNVKAYGAVGDGATDDTAAIQAAIDAAPTRGGVVYFPTGIYKITATLSIGNGTSTTFSTDPPVALVGESALASSVARPASNVSATTIIWAGAAGGTMVTISGPLSGCRVEGLVFDCDVLANTALNLLHVDKSTFRNIEVIDNKGYGIILTAYPQNAATWNGANNNSFENIAIESATTSSGGLSIGPADTDGGGILDVAQCHFNNLRLRFDNATTATAILLQFTDFLTFTNCLAWVKVGGVGLQITHPTGTNGTLFPSSIAFYNCAIPNVAQAAGWAGIGRILFFPFHTSDGEALPTVSSCAGVTDGGVWFGTWDAASTLALSSVTMTAGAGLTGGGDLTASRTFAVGAGLGITVNADDVALTTPGTLTVATTNNSTGSHTHAITASANPGVAAAILASAADGSLILTTTGAVLPLTLISDTAGYGLHITNSVAEGSGSGGVVNIRGAITPSNFGKRLGVLSFSAISTGTTYVNGATIKAVSAGAWGAADASSYLVFSVTPAGSTTPADALLIMQDGILRLQNAASWTANGVVATVLTGLGPAGIGTVTVSKWLTLYDDAGVAMYIPAWT